MISNYAKDSLIVINSLLGVEGDDYSCRRFSIDCAFSFRERKYVFAVINELERCWKLALIDNI